MPQTPSSSTLTRPEARPQGGSKAGALAGGPAASGASGPLGNPQASLHLDRRGRSRQSGEESPAEREERRERERAARARRYWRREQMRPLVSLQRLRDCGAKVITNGGVTVGVATNPDGTTHAGYGGVSTCGSVHSCWNCAAVVATRRADELADVMRVVDALGGSAFMLTLTMRHAAGDRLGWNRQQRRRWEALERCRKARKRAEKDPELNVARRYEAQTWVGGTPDPDEGPQSTPRAHVCDIEAELAERAELEAARGCWDAVADGWEAVTSGGTWVKDQAKHGGMLGWAKVVETTDGSNGWHVHIHALLCFAEDVDQADAEVIARRMFKRWKRALEARGFDASGDFGADGRIPGWDLRKAQLGDGDLAHYFTKLAHEVTSGHRKEGRRRGGRTPFQLAADAADTYEAQTLARWWEWEASSAGRRQLTWSGGERDLRKLAQLGPELTDEEIAAEEHPADERLGLSPEVWGWVRSSDHITTVLDVAETQGLDGLAGWLDQHGQDCTRGIGLGWIERPAETPGAPIETWDGNPSWRPGTVPRDEGAGAGYQLAPPAVLRGRDATGRAHRRPSDRPPRWSNDAHAATRGQAHGKLAALRHHRGNEGAGDDG